MCGVLEISKLSLTKKVREREEEGLECKAVYAPGFMAQRGRGLRQTMFVLRVHAECGLSFTVQTVSYALG